MGDSHGSLDKETYKNVRPLINEENKRTVNVFTILGAACFLITAFFSIVKNVNVPLSVYIVGIGLFILMHIINSVLYKKIPVISEILAVLYSGLLMASGIFLAYSQSNERTTILLPFYALVSLVFCYRPIYLLVILALTEMSFLFVMNGVQSENLYFVNLINTSIFCFVGIVGGLYTLVMKHLKYKAEYENQILLEKDVLTGLYNRYSCKIAFDNILKDKKPVTICSFDEEKMEEFDKDFPYKEKLVLPGQLI